MELKWTKNLITGISEIDDKNEILIERFANFYEALISGGGKEDVKILFEFFADYSKEKFINEEKFQKKFEYPDYQRHKKIHFEIAKEIELFKNQILSKSEDEIDNDILIKADMIIVDFLRNHIGIEDRKLVNYILEKNNK